MTELSDRDTWQYFDRQPEYEDLHATPSSAEYEAMGGDTGWIERTRTGSHPTHMGELTPAEAARAWEIVQIQEAGRAAWLAEQAERLRPDLEL
ncbi:MAG TPA: hypothetical protein VMK13_13525 [Streptosporangiaceae bacterium]|nr:hypothetical protein [Streptosporangiaceae bacterium]